MFSCRSRFILFFQAPPGYKVMLSFTGAFGVYFYNLESCFHWVEVKYDRDLVFAGPRFEFCTCFGLQNVTYYIYITNLNFRHICFFRIHSTKKVIFFHHHYRFLWRLLIFSFVENSAWSKTIFWLLIEALKQWMSP